MLEAIQARVEPLGANLYALAVASDAGEETWQCQPANPCNDAYSVAKAFVMSAVGLLCDRGLMAPDEPLLDALRLRLPEGADPAWARVTVAHALTHTVGFDQPGFLDIDVDDGALYGREDHLACALATPLAFEPGTRSVYTDGAYYLLARAVEATSGEDFAALIWRDLLAPMDAREVAWSRCPLGHVVGASGLYTRPITAARLGLVYADGGVFRGKRLLSEAWTEEAVRRGFAFTSVGGREDVYGKGGAYGQMLLFSRKRRVSVAWNGFMAGDMGGRVTDAVLSALE